VAIRGGTTEVKRQRTGKYATNTGDLHASRSMVVGVVLASIRVGLGGKENSVRHQNPTSMQSIRGWSSEERSGRRRRIFFIGEEYGRSRSEVKAGLRIGDLTIKGVWLVEQFQKTLERLVVVSFGLNVLG